MHINSYPNIL